MHIAGILLVFLSTWVTAGTTVRPVVNFTPDWNKIFTGESITMSCDVKSLAQGDLIYNWYKDGDWVHTGKSYTILKAQHSHSGNYQCQTSFSDRSDSARLDVCTGYVILQAPLHVYEGDNVTLRCNHYPDHAAKQTVFSKDGEIIQDWSLESELFIDNVDNKSVQRYKCTKQVYHHLLYYRHTDELTFYAQELFTPPILRLTEEDDMTLTCETSLSPLRKTTELQFAFYKDGQCVQNYSPADRFTIPSALLKHSGSYMCQVRTSTNTVEKTSVPLHIEATIEELFTLPVLRLMEDHITLECETSLSPLRKTTELQFAFYKDGQNVLNYSPADRFTIPSALLKHSGSYMCQVRTSTNTVEKTSVPLHIEATIEESFDFPEIAVTTYPVTPHPAIEENNNLVSILPVTLLVVLLLLVVAILFFMYKRKQIWLSVNNQQQITVFEKEDNMEIEDTFVVSEVFHTPQNTKKSFTNPPGYSKVPALENA